MKMQVVCLFHQTLELGRIIHEGLTIMVDKNVVLYQRGAFPDGGWGWDKWMFGFPGLGLVQTKNNLL